jgi:hypothetical protein
LKRRILVAIAVSLLLPAGAEAQYRAPTLAADAGAYQPVFREHADGGEVPVAVGLTTLAGLTVFDIAAAGGSARAFNAANPNRPPKSPGAALALSIGATVVPFAAGLLLFDQGLGGTSVSSAGLVLSMSAIAAGPGAGHLYAGNRRRALRNAAIRGGLLVGTVALEQCCT